MFRGLRPLKRKEEDLPMHGSAESVGDVLYDILVFASQHDRIDSRG